MRFERTDHRDGSTSIRLYPENAEEMRKMGAAFGTHRPGSVTRSKGRALIEVPILSKEGNRWDNEDFNIGPKGLEEELFIWRIIIRTDE